MKKNKEDKNIQDTLESHHACYVLITCGLPEDDGGMKVEMSYKGDPCLAAYLLKDAQSRLENLETE